MRVLLLSPSQSSLAAILRDAGEDVLIHSASLDEITAKSFNAAFVVCHGYRHILRQDVLALFPNRVVNLHISLLPYNRGADPNLWSFLEDTPKGVSIHYVDEGVDTGDLIAQAEVSFEVGETLASTYDKLQKRLEALFVEVWPLLRTGDAPRWRQPAHGKSHRMKDKEPYLHLLAKKWQTPVESLVGRALSSRAT